MFSSIRVRLLAAFAALVVFALVASTVINYVVASSYNDDAIAQNLTSLTSGHVAGIGTWVASKTQMIESLRDAALSHDPSPALRQVAAAGGFTNVYVGYANRTATFADPTGVPSDYDPTSRPWYTQAVQAGRTVVTLPYADGATGRLVVAFASPVVRDGVVQAVVSGDVAMDSVIANVKSIRPTPASFGMLIDNAGRIVAHPDANLTLKPAANVAPELGGAALSSIAAANAPVEVRVGDDAKLVRAQRVPGTDWYAVVALDKREATAGMRSLLLASLATLVVIVGVASLIV
ncbi:MAG TPA: cache domain-containing protein, partial [Paraburkholderia sp.]|nr:cache domain-containing protein [Paraburkholderia sp.]